MGLEFIGIGIGIGIWNSNSNSNSKLEGGWKVGRAGQASRAGSDTKNRNFFGHSKMIGGLFRVENRVRSAPQKKFLEPAGPNKK